MGRLGQGAEQGAFDVDRALLKVALAGELFGGALDPVQLGRFRVLGRLGAGAMGVVYEAQDTERDARVALKVLGRVDARAIYHLKREFRALADVVHPSLVTLHELFEARGVWFFTMDLVQGVAFDQWVREQPSGFDEARLRDALQQLAVAVSALHGASRLHCDLKPSNVLVTAEGKLLLLDFGLASELDGQLAMAQSGLAGTPAYLSPEQAMGGEPSRASDWYAVGVMLFEALTGQLPFRGHPLKVLREKQQRNAPDPRSLAPGLPDDLCALCVGLLIADPALRHGARQVLVEPRKERSARVPLSMPDVEGPAGVFVGRHAELASLRAALDEVEARRAVTLLLSGRSGVGKSALLDRFVSEAAQRSLVLRGRCHEAESVPYKVFDCVVDALLHFLRQLPAVDRQGLVPRHTRALIQLFPVLGQLPEFANAATDGRTSADSRKLRDEGFAALKELLLRLTDRGTVTIVVDDLQWGDLDSARMLEHVLAMPDAPPLLFIGAYRSDELQRSDFLRSLLGRDLVATLAPRELRLPPLDRASATELVRKLLGARSAIAESIAAEARGVPLFIAQLAQHQRMTAPRSGRPDASLVSLERVIIARVNALPEGPRRLLQVLSVAMGPLPSWVAAEAAGLPPAERSALLRLRAARLIRTRAAASESVETYHDRIRETVAAQLRAGDRRALHAAIVRALQHHGLHDPERLLPHHAGAGDTERAAQAAILAARLAAQKLAFNRAAALFAQAIELLPRKEAVALGLHHERACALADAGRGVPAAASYIEAASGAPPAQARRMLRLAAQQYLRSGRSATGIALMRSSLRPLGVEIPATAWGRSLRLLAEELSLRWRGLHVSNPPRVLSSLEAERLDALSEVYPELLGTEPLEGALLHAYCLRQALDAGDAARSVQGLAWAALGRAYVGGAVNERRAASMMSGVFSLAREVDTPYAHGMAQLAEAARLMNDARHFRDARQPAYEALELFSRCPGAFWERAVVTFNLLTCLEWTQDLAEVSRRGRELLREATERDDRFGALLTTTAATYAFLMRDDPDAARVLLERHRTWLPPEYTTFHYLWLLRAIDTLCYAGCELEVQQLIDREWPAFQRSVLYRCALIRDTARIFAARCTLGLYIRTRAREHRRRALRGLRPFREVQTAFAPYAAALRAAMHEADGEPEAALRLLQASHEQHAACQSGFGLYGERMLHDLRGDSAAVQRVDEHLREQGVVNPERWAQTHLPRSVR